MFNPRLLTVGSINSGVTPIQVDMPAPNFSTSVRVTLLTDYEMLAPDSPLIQGFPFRPSFTGSATPNYPHTIPSGTTLVLLKCESDALIAAGAAVLA